MLITKKIVCKSCGATIITPLSVKLWEPNNNKGEILCKKCAKCKCAQQHNCT